MDTLWLLDVDLSPVPAQHLASLALCVTFRLSIRNVSGCDLVSILTSLIFYHHQPEAGEAGDPGPGAGNGVCCEEVGAV